MVCLHHKQRIGRFREIKACVKCQRVWIDYEAMGLAQGAAYFDKRSVADGYSGEERTILQEIGAL
jgi:hypothetical protein